MGYTFLYNVEVGTEEWTYQVFYDERGNVEAVRLYNAEGDFVTEFWDIESMEKAIKNGPKSLEVVLRFREVWKERLGEENKGIGIITKEEKAAVQEALMRRLKMLQGEMSCAEFAKVVDLNPSVISNYSSGGRMPTAAALNRIAEKCGVSVDWLLGRDE